MRAKSVIDFIEATKDDMIKSENDLKQTVCGLLEYMKTHRFIPSRLQTKVKELDTNELYIANCSEVDRRLSNISSVVLNESAISSVGSSPVMLQERVEELDTQVHALEASTIDLTLKLTKSMERITDQTRTIDELEREKTELRKQIIGLSETNLALSARFTDFSDMLFDRSAVYPQDPLVRNVDAFDRLNLTYSLETLNQYISSGASISLTKSSTEIVERALDTIRDVTYIEPVYIVTLLSGKVFSRFDVERCYAKLDQNALLDKEKMTRHIIVSLMEKDLSMLNKSIYVKLLNHMAQSDMVNNDMVIQASKKHKEEDKD